MNKIKFVDPSVTHVEKKNLNKALKEVGYLLVHTLKILKIRCKLSK